MKSSITILVLLVASAAFGQASISWIQNTPGVAVALDNSNNVFTARSENIPGGDIYVTKRDLSGVLLWERRYDQTDSTKFEKAVWLDVDPSGNAVVAGNIMPGAAATNPGAGLVMKFDPSGNLLWRKVFTSSADLMQLNKVLTDASGSIYLLGKALNNLTVISLQVRKLTPDGFISWTVTNMEIGSAVNFKLTRDNCLLVSARSGNAGPNGFLKITSLGNILWSIRIMNTSASGDAAGDISGNTYIVNREAVTAVPGSIIRKFDPAGVQIWQRSISFYSQKIETGTDNLPVAAGSPMTNTSGTALAKLDAGGNQLWINPDADGSNNLIQHVQLGLDARNNSYVFGNTSAGMAMCKVGSTGSNGWNISIPGTGAAGFDMGTDNCIYLTGGVTAKIRQSLQCPVPGNLFTNSITPVSAKLNWDLVPGALRYEIIYRSLLSPSVNRIWERRTVPGDQNFLILTGLKCNTPYQWQIRAVCDTLLPAINTGFSASQTFRTSPCTNAADLEGYEPGITGSDGSDITEPERMRLYNNFPNPFNPSTDIKYDVSEDANVSIVIFNVLGQKVNTLVDGFRKKGTYSVSWSGKDANGSELPGGAYFFRMTAGSFVEVRKMVLAK